VELAMTVNFEERDQHLRDSLRLQNQSESYRHQAVVARSRADQETDPAKKVKHEADADRFQARSDDLAQQQKAEEQKYFKSDMNVRKQIRTEQDPTARKALRDEDVARKADIHLDAAGKTKAERTQEGARTSVKYMGVGERPARMNNFAKGTDFSRKVEVERLPEGSTMSQYPHAKYGNGNYFAQKSAEPDRVGIDASRREPHQQRQVNGRVRALKSRATPARDDFSDDRGRTVTHTRGGDRQYVIKDSMQERLSEPVSAKKQSQKAAFGTSKSTKNPSYGDWLKKQEQAKTPSMSRK